MSAAELERLYWTPPDGQERSCPHLSYSGYVRTCKRRDCRRCGRPWARSWESVIRQNLDHRGAPVTLITITAPGADALPWACARKHRHAGHKGCRVDDEAADRWSERVGDQWSKLRGAARKAAAERLPDGVAPYLLVRAWEPQKRGVPHLHLVLSFGAELERVAARRFVEELARLAPDYGFGFVDRHLQQITAREASSYLAGYLVGRGSKESIRENIADPRMPRSLVWVSPVLTSPCERFDKARRLLGISGASFVTMRRLRLVRWYFAALSGRCDVFPRLFGELLIQVATVAARVEPKRARAPGEDERACFHRHFSTLLQMRRIARPGEWWALRAPAAAAA